MTASKSRMFPFITCTWNPLGGRCPHNCVYCWSMGPKGFVAKYGMWKYRGPARLVSTAPFRKFKAGEFVFVCDMCDLFASTVPDDAITTVLDAIRQSPKAKFLLLTKNPQRYLDLDVEWPSNIIFGATIESNIDYPSLSKAPLQSSRLSAMLELAGVRELRGRMMISIEPILSFGFHGFVEDLGAISPGIIAIGYDNYNHHLPEPTLAETMQLIEELERRPGWRIYRKTLRKAWNETR